MDRRHVLILHELALIRQSVARLEYEVVQFLRDGGVSWDDIGESLDPPISRQAAARRFGRPRQRRG